MSLAAHLATSSTVNNHTQLVACVTGGVLILIVIYTMRDYIVVGLVGAGAIYLYKLATESKDRNRRL